MISKIYKEYSSRLRQYSPQLIHIVVTTLDHELFKSRQKGILIQLILGGKGPDILLATSALIAACEILYDDEVALDPNQLKILFDSILFVANPPETLKKYDLPKAGLSILRSHCSKFEKQVFQTYAVLYRILMKLGCKKIRIKIRLFQQ